MVSRWNLIVLCVLLGVVSLITLRQRDQTPPTSREVSTPAANATAKPVSLEPTGPAPPDELPNLVITDIYFDEPYLRVNYSNTGGTRVAADFTMSWSSPEKTFGGNSNYRRQVPAPGDERQTGGLTPGLIKAVPGQPLEVTVEIDPENRVSESNEFDNAKRVTLTLGQAGSQRDKLELVPVSYDPNQGWEALDLIVSDAQLSKSGALTIVYSNQGYQNAAGSFDLLAGPKRGEKTRLTGLKVPEPGQSLQVTSLDVVGLTPSEIVEITLDPDGVLTGERSGNNVFLRQLDNSHDLNGRPAR